MRVVVKLLTASALLLAAVVLVFSTLGGSSLAKQNAPGRGDVAGVSPITLPLSPPAPTPGTTPSPVPVTTTTTLAVIPPTTPTTTSTANTATTSAPNSGTSDLLTSPVTYGQGEIRFDPVPNGFVPGVTAEAAHQSFVSASGSPNGSTPTIQLALYTAYGQGTAGPDGQIILVHVKQPVWVLTYTNVASSASGGGSSAGQPPSSQPLVVHNVVGIVDANTGQDLSELDAVPDPAPYPAR